MPTFQHQWFTINRLNFEKAQTNQLVQHGLCVGENSGHKKHQNSLSTSALKGVFTRCALVVSPTWFRVHKTFPVTPLQRGTARVWLAQSHAAHFRRWRGRQRGFARRQVCHDDRAAFGVGNYALKRGYLAGGRASRTVGCCGCRHQLSWSRRHRAFVGARRGGGGGHLDVVCRLHGAANAWNHCSGVAVLLILRIVVHTALKERDS